MTNPLLDLSIILLYIIIIFKNEIIYHIINSTSYMFYILGNIFNNLTNVYYLNNISITFTYLSVISYYIQYSLLTILNI